MPLRAPPYHRFLKKLKERAAKNEDREALGLMIVAGALTSDPTKGATRGCQIIPDDAKLELLERSPSVFPFMRTIRVKVTSPTQPDLTSGFTIEMGR